MQCVSIDSLHGKQIPRFYFKIYCIYYYFMIKYKITLEASKKRTDIFMDLATLIVSILTTLIITIGGWYFKNFFPKYMEKKGENLATKEDIAEITRRTEEVQRDFKERFALFSSDVKFKYDFYYKQYSDLYCKLYSIIIQSEYIRVFLKKSQEKDFPFDDYPFLEMNNRTVKQTYSFEAGKTVAIDVKDELIQTPITQFNKAQLCDLIIENRSLATQELLKLTVSYRFAYNYYSGNTDVPQTSVSKTADEEEFQLIRKIVCEIVKDYNHLRKELKMPFNEQELSDGIPHL